MKIGVFDSGIGGEAIAKYLDNYFPSATVITVNDKQNVPYGSKTAKEIISLTDSAIQPLIKKQCDVIVIACNTATSVAIETIRSKYPDQKFIGIEPMVKTAAKLSKSRTVAVCATPATLNSDRYKLLKNSFGSSLNIIEPDCSNWAQMIEFNQINYQLIESTISDACKKGADVIVLGCTHYHWIKDTIDNLSNGRAKVIEPSDAIARQIELLLKSS